MNMIDVTPRAPEPRKPSLVQRLLVSTGIYKAATNIVAGVNNSSFFGPGQPLTPMGPPGEIGRALNYRVSTNTNIQPRTDESVSMGDLFLLAENHDITRLCIETRKDQVVSLNWVVRPVQKSKQGTKSQEITPEQQNRIDACTAFLKTPDGVTPFSVWVRMLLEDVLVYDAASIFVNEDDPDSTKFELISGMTIKRIVDEQGRTPQPPSPAFQQVIHGMPAWNYTAEQLIYAMRNPRPNRLYGMSPVQQIVMTVNIALRKQMSQLEYFTQGNIPDALISVPENWTPAQIVEFQGAWDAIFEGNTAERRHAKFVPGGVNIEQTKPAILKDEFDEWLTRVVCYAFSIPPTAFTKTTNRATAGSQKDQAKEEGLMPLIGFLAEMITGMLQKYLLQADLEFAWEEDDEEDPQVKVGILDTQLRSGAITLNEYREAMGRESYGPDGDMPMIYSGTGATPLERVITPPAPGEPGGPPAMLTGPGGKGPNGESLPNGAPKAGGPAGSEPAAARPKQLPGGSSAPEPAAASATQKAVGADGAKTLYIRRNLLNADDVLAWAKTQGFTSTLPASDMHVTIAYSKTAVDWNMVSRAPDNVRVSTGSRAIVEFGSGAVVLKFGSLQLSNRFQSLKDIGCTWDWPSYQPHVTLTYEAPDMDLDDVQPYDGVLVFGPEIMQEVKENWMDDVEEQTLKARRWTRGRELIVHR